MPNVEVLPYNPEWKKWFKEIKKPVWNQIHDLINDIVHVGSTSIEGMSAKPIIDMDIVIDNWDIFPEIVRRLEPLGYRHVGDLGIAEREVFKHENPGYPHHLYVCQKDSTAYRNHVLLRKHLLENSEDFNRYRDLKTRLASSVNQREDYGRLKTELILEFLEKEGISKKEIEKIRKENQD
jgi:GrpB-like predicted nucleotidyltransferase (UPF0157 family)